eukprot:1157266-Pelagomonas_calceolata.AAC.14
MHANKSGKAPQCAGSSSKQKGGFARIHLQDDEHQITNMHTNLKAILDVLATLAASSKAGSV